ncbi:MAG: alkyl hydroperoxide reductase, partial [Blastocatellia bacterium]
IECTAHFDNSTNNKYNPDPTKDVRWGDQTWEEMMIGWLSYYDASPRPTEKPAAATSSSEK